MLARWREALDGLVVRHPDDRRTVILELVEPALLYFHVLQTPCTVTGVIVDDFSVSTVELCVWPGIRLARAWVAAAWTAYIQHESLELVRHTDGTWPIDPHDPSNEYARALREGLPVKLTRESLETSLCVVVPPEQARRMMADLGEW